MYLILCFNFFNSNSAQALSKPVWGRVCRGGQWGGQHVTNGGRGHPWPPFGSAPASTSLAKVTELHCEVVFKCHQHRVHVKFKMLIFQVSSGMQCLYSGNSVHRSESFLFIYKNISRESDQLIHSPLLCFFSCFLGFFSPKFSPQCPILHHHIQ